MAAPNIVAVTSIYGKTMGANLGTTLTTDILSCPSNKVLKINSIIVANVDGSTAADATIYFFDNSASTRYQLASTVAVPADTSLVILDKNNAIYLEESDQIEGGASATGDLVITISYEEIDDA